MNIKTVLIPVDFSPTSTLAVNYGIALARRFGARPSLLHVIESPPALLYAFPVEMQRVETQRCDQADKMLRALVCSKDEDDLDPRYVVAKGSVDECIETAVREEQADVVVMGTHGRSLLSRLLLGSVTQKLLRKISVPVLSVSRVSRPLHFNRFMFATDFGPGAEDAFKTALELAEQLGSCLVVAHNIDKRPVVAYETPEIANVFDQDREHDITETRDRFKEFREAATARGVKIECVLGEDGAADSLLRIAEEKDVDFIMLGLRERGVLDRALLGSTAEPVIRGAHVPVLSIPIDIRNVLRKTG